MAIGGYCSLLDIKEAGEDEEDVAKSSELILDVLIKVYLTMIWGIKFCPYPLYSQRHL